MGFPDLNNEANGLHPLFKFRFFPLPSVRLPNSAKISAMSEASLMSSNALEKFPFPLHRVFSLIGSFHKWWIVMIFRGLVDHSMGSLFTPFNNLLLSSGNVQHSGLNLCALWPSSFLIFSVGSQDSGPSPWGYGKLSVIKSGFYGDSTS